MDKSKIMTFVTFNSINDNIDWGLNEKGDKGGRERNPCRKILFKCGKIISRKLSTL